MTEIRLPDLFLVFDVESIGLHGEGFAVGWVVVRSVDGERQAEGEVGCLPQRANGTRASMDWVEANVPKLDVSRDWPRDVRAFFWQVWSEWKNYNAWLAADVPWPVEANFLSLALIENGGGDFDGPYPLLDIASMQFAKRMNPIAVVDRLPDELPQHSPLADAKQSARLLLEVLAKERGL